jgi:hypothetical protein
MNTSYVTQEIAVLRADALLACVYLMFHISELKGRTLSEQLSGKSRKDLK